MEAQTLRQLAEGVLFDRSAFYTFGRDKHLGEEYFNAAMLPIGSVLTFLTQSLYPL